MEAQTSLIDDTQRLQQLSSSLNLDDFDKLSSDAYSAFCPVAVDFLRLRAHVQKQERVCFQYGLDHAAFDQAAFRGLEGIASHLATLPQAPEAYCQLKSQLFLGQNDFLDVVIQEVEERTAACESRAQAERLMLAVLLIRDAYDAIL